MQGGIEEGVQHDAHKDLIHISEELPDGVVAAPAIV